MEYNDYDVPLTLEEEEKLAVELGMNFNSEPTEKELHDYLTGNLQTSRDH